MDVYHGTNDSAANSIVTRIDVSAGGGELGQGFYAGEHIALAAAWAQGRFQQDFKVVKLAIDDSAFINLSIKQLNHFGYVLRQWNTLKRLRQTRSYLFGTDVVIAPFALISFSSQFKFESAKAERLLNDPLKTIKTVL